MQVSVDSQDQSSAFETMALASLHGYYYAFFMAFTAFTKVKKVCFDFANVIRARFGDAKKVSISVHAK